MDEVGDRRRAVRTDEAGEIDAKWAEVGEASR